MNSILVYKVWILPILFNRPGVAGPVLQTYLSFIHWFSRSSFVIISSTHLHLQTKRARELKLLEYVHPLHVSHVTSHMSRVTSHTSHISHQMSCVMSNIYINIYSLCSQNKIVTVFLQAFFNNFDWLAQFVVDSQYVNIHTS